MITWWDSSCVFTDGTLECVKVIFIWLHDGILAVCTDGRCDSVNVILK